MHLEWFCVFERDPNVAGEVAVVI